MDNIDREIKKILENLPPKDNIPEIIIDKRTDNFWNVNREWVPIRHQKEYLEYEYSPIADELDHIYHRYIVEPKEQGLLSDDYTVRDIENQFVSYSL
ncbi:MAG: hypothetical protein KIS29_11355, partial [Thermoplasmata archaeon]|nr:hypothetical protein [Candidatus Sysuiplasma jiujiangense]